MLHETMGSGFGVNESFESTSGVTPALGRIGWDLTVTPFVGSEESVVDHSNSNTSSNATVRARLLAKRFAGAKLTQEEEVRLAIAATRLETSAPRVSSESEEALSALEREIAEMRDRRLASEARLSLFGK